MTQGVFPGPAVAVSPTGTQLAQGPKGLPGQQGQRGPAGSTGPAGPPGAAASQGTISLVNGLNSNVATTGSSSVRFSGYTGPVILGGIAPPSTPTGGQVFTLTFLVANQPVTIRNADAASTSANQILTGTGQDVFLPLGAKVQCQLTWDATLNMYQLTSSGVQQQREFNVLNWGFDPTGTNANDTAMTALAAAVTAALGSAATAAGGTAKVFFPRGTYLFANAVTGFPNQVTFEGVDGNGTAGIGSTLVFTGSGIFWGTNNVQGQHFKHLAFVATAAASTSYPAQANIITVATNATPIEITTATPHGYVTGDLVGIYGVTGNTAANCYPGNPWTITVIDSTHYTLNGSVGNGSYTPTTLTVSGATNAAGGNASPILITTTTPAGLNYGSLCYIASVGGNTTANGLMRVCPTGTGTGPTTTLSGTVTATQNSTALTFTSSQTLPAGAVLNFGGTTSYTLASAMVATTAGVMSVKYQGATAAGLTATVTGPGSRVFPICTSMVNAGGIQPGGGVYTSGGTVTTGGVCVLYSRIPLVGLSLQGLNASWCSVDSCTFYGFKYGISCDGLESGWISNCKFLEYGPGLGYSSDMPNNDSWHSAAGIRLGSFTIFGDGFGITNVVAIDTCSFYNTYCGTMHQDGVGHYVTRCLYEQSVVAILGECGTVAFDKLQNDGSADTVGLIQQRTEPGLATITTGLAVRDSLLSGLTAPLVSVPDNMSGLHIKNVASNTTLPTVISTGGGLISPVSVVGVTSNYNPLVSNGVTAVYPNQGVPAPGQSGTAVNHLYPPEAAIDVAYAPITTQATSGLRVRSPQDGLVFHDKAWTSASTDEGGTFQGYDQVISNNSGAMGALNQKALAYATVAAGSGSVAVGGLAVPGGQICSGILTVVVCCVEAQGAFLQSNWMFRYQYVNSDSGVFLGRLIESEVYDAIGIGTAPVVSLTTGGALSVACYKQSTYVTVYSVSVETKAVGV
jgi:hypothetical protein